MGNINNDDSRESKKNVTPDLSRAREEFEKEVENSEMGTEMIDYGDAGPGASRDDSSTRSEDSTSKDPE